MTLAPLHCPIIGAVYARRMGSRCVLVPVEGIEPPTFGLQNRCSTAELNRLIELRLEYGCTPWEAPTIRLIADPDPVSSLDGPDGQRETI